AAQAGILDLLDDRVRATLKERLGVVPVAALHRGVDVPALIAVEVGEDAVFILQHFPPLTLCSSTSANMSPSLRPQARHREACIRSRHARAPQPERANAHTTLSFNVVGPPTGAENCRSTCGPGFGCSPRARASRMALVLSY